jgi:hypothetical protein
MQEKNSDKETTKNLKEKGNHYSATKANAFS